MKTTLEMSAVLAALAPIAAGCHVGGGAAPAKPQSAVGRVALAEPPHRGATGMEEGRPLPRVEQEAKAPKGDAETQAAAPPAEGAAEGAKLEATYKEDLGLCSAAARRASKALQFTVTHEESLETSSRIDAQTADRIPVHFILEKAAGEGTRATFLAGESASSEHEALAKKMKEEFDRRLTASPEPAADENEPRP